MKMRLFIPALAGLAIVVPGAIRVTATNLADVQHNDQKANVLSSLHHANQMEIKMGQKAQNQATSEDVRIYAERMIADRQENDQKTKDMADREGVRLTDLDEQTEGKAYPAMKNLENLNGADFDREFARTMVNQHKQEIGTLIIAQRDL